ncbi:response regulator, partial [Acinetobacter baumannii]
VVGVAATADDGFRLVRDGRPDLVFLDINLRSPVSGIDLARRIHGISPARIVFLTGQDDDQTRRQASSVAPLAFLLKPWSQARLRE